MGLFNASGDNFLTSGVANRMYDILKGGSEDITEKAGGGEFQIYDDSILGKQIRDMEDRITSHGESYLEPKSATGKSLLLWNRPYNMQISRACGWPRK
jgi:hypothetical protein